MPCISNGGAMTHTPEWPEFLQHPKLMPNTGLNRFVLISEYQYNHARACVNACAGKSNAELNGDLFTEGELATAVALATAKALESAVPLARKEAQQQRDELVDSYNALSVEMRRDKPDFLKCAGIVAAALARQVRNGK